MSSDTSDRIGPSRRWFVRASAAVVASVGLAGCYHDEEDDGGGGGGGGGGYGDAEPPDAEPPDAEPPDGQPGG